MKTYEQELLELQQKQAREIQELASRYSVIAQLPNIGDYAPPFIHHHKLYGSVGSVNYNIQWYSSIAKGKNPDAVLLKQLLTSHPPVDMIKIKRGCTSIQPEPETYESNNDTIEIDPVIIRLDPSQHGSSISVDWYGRIGEHLWRFDVEFPYHNQKIGIPNYRWNHYAGGNGEVSSVEFIGFKPVPLRAKYIKWGGGSSKDPGSITVYWERGDGPDVEGLVELFT